MLPYDAGTVAKWVSVITFAVPVGAVASWADIAGPVPPLFSSSWQEVHVLNWADTGVVPMNPPGSSTLRILPDTALPAREAIEKRLPPPPIKP